MVAEQFSGQFSFLNGCWAILPAMTFLKEEDAENSDGFEKDASKARISFRNLNLQIFKYPIQWKYTETIMFLYSVRRGHHPDLHMTNRNLRSSRQLWISAHPGFLPGPGRDLGEELRNSWIFLNLTGPHCDVAGMAVCFVIIQTKPPWNWLNSCSFKTFFKENFDDNLH